MVTRDGGSGHRRVIISVVISSLHTPLVQTAEEKFFLVSTSCFRKK